MEILALYSYSVLFMLKIKGMFLSMSLYDNLTKRYFIGIKTNRLLIGMLCWV